jgi:hypothetical protein
VLLAATNRDMYVVEIAVDPPYRRQGIGRALFTELLQARQQPFPMMARAMASRPERLAFALALGFHVVMTCPMPQVDPTTPEAQGWIKRQRAPAGIRLVSASEVSDSALTDAWTNLYEWMHESWSPITSRENVARAFVEQYLPTLDRTHSVFAVEGGEIVASGFVSLDVWDGRNFAIVGTTQPTHPEGGHLVGAVAAALLQRLARSKVRLVEFEGHDIDPHISVLTSIPRASADPLTILLSAE